LAICGIDEHIRIKVLVRREGQLDTCPLIPLLGLLGVPGADYHLMTGAGEGLTECPPDRTRSQNGNLHADIMTETIAASVGNRGSQARCASSSQKGES
jgi:hypothetical protein